MFQKCKQSRKRVLSLLLVIAMLFPVTETALASESSPEAQSAFQENGAESDNGGAVTSCTDMVQTQDVGVRDGKQTQPEQPGQLQTAGVIYPTFQEAYNTMIGLKDKYPEGTKWTNFEPYGNGKDAIADSYSFKGGPVKGAQFGVGCAAFVFLLSDAVFGEYPATTYDQGQFTYKDVKVGDILRVDNSHFVIVLQKSAAGVVVAEGNYNKTVHWGRVMSVNEVMESNFIVSRYPKNYVDESVADADKIMESGVEGSNLSWSLTHNGVLTISGSGVIQNYDEAGKRPSWEAENASKISSVHIESGITGIGDYAFCNTPALDVYIPNTVTSIGAGALKNASIVGITIPGSVKTIGHSAFYGCSSLTSVSISEGLTAIGNNAFYGCTTLKYVDFPASVTLVGDGAFACCNSIVSVRFAPGTEKVSIGANPFTECQQLRSVTLPENIDRISNGMFAGCISLTYLCIPAGVEYIYEAGVVGGFPFSQTAISVIDFCGSESEWNDKGGNLALNGTNGGGANVTVNFNAKFNNPFAPIEGDPGDLIKDPAEHVHKWAAGYASDASYHWHECEVNWCTVTENAGKDGYGEHVYGGWITDTAASSYASGSRHRDCTVCGYSQTESIPATGGSSGSSGGSWNYGNWGGTGSSTGTGNNGNNTPKPEEPKDTDTGNDTNTDSNPATPDSPGGTDTTEPVTKPEDTVKPVNTAKVKKQMKTELKGEMKTSLKKQLKSALKTRLKKQIGKLPKAKLKTRLKKQLKTELSTKLKKQLKKKMQKQFKKSLGSQFTAEFNKQYNELLRQLYTKQFDSLFKQLYKQVKAAR